MDSQIFMPKILGLVSDIDGVTNVLELKGIQESSMQDTYLDYLGATKEMLIEFFTELNMLEKVISYTRGEVIDKSAFIGLWPLLCAKIDLYQGDKLHDIFSRLLTVKNDLVELFKELPPFKKIDEETEILRLKQLKDKIELLQDDETNFNIAFELLNIEYHYSGGADEPHIPGSYNSELRQTLTKEAHAYRQTKLHNPIVGAPTEYRVFIRSFVSDLNKQITKIEFKNGMK